MHTFRRIVTGLVFAATIALALNASSGDALAKAKSGGGNAMLLGGITIDLDHTTPTDFHVGGVTWE